MHGFPAQKKRQHLANGGPVFGARGLDAMRAMVPQMQAMGFNPPPQAPAPVAPAPYGARGVDQVKALIPQMQAMGFPPAGMQPDPQGFADGGLIGRVKQVLGMDEERNARIAAYKQQKAADAAAAKASNPAPAAPAPAPAVTDYSSGGAAKRREAAAGLANGGMIRGPGTGTSDDILTEKPPGTFIMPADSTQAIGEEQLDGMSARGFNPGGKKVPVALSNGEYEFTPEQVQQVGEQTLRDMKDATHTPVQQQGQTPEAERIPLANGDTPEERRRQARQQGNINWPYTAAEAGRSPYVGAPVAPAAPVLPTQVEGWRTKAVMDGAAQDAQQAWDQGSVSGAAGAVARGAITAIPTAVGEFAANTAAPLVSAARGFYGGLTGDAPAPAAAPTAPSTAAAIAPRATTVPNETPNPTDMRLAAGAQMGAADPRPMGQYAADQVENVAGSRQIAPGVYRNGNSYGDSPAAAATGPTATGRPSAQNMQAAESLAARGFNPAAAAVPATPSVAAPIVRTSANDWQNRNDLRNLEVSAKSITANGGRFDPTKGNNVEQAAYRAAVATDNAARGFQPQADKAAMEANANLQREQMQQQGGIAREQVQQTGANSRAALGFRTDQARLGVDASRAASENAQRNVATAGAEQIQKLRNVLLDPNATAEQRTQAEKSLRAVGGKAETANRYTVVPGGQEISPQGLAYTRPSQVLDNQTGQFVNQPGAAGALPPGMVRLVGTSNGRPVYEDAQGKRYGG